MTFECFGGCREEEIAPLVEDHELILHELVVNAGHGAPAKSPSDELGELLGAPSVGLSIKHARIVGNDSRASADITFSNATTVTFDTLSEFANPTQLAVQMGVGIGVELTLKRPKALRALVLLREIAEREQTFTADEIAADLGTSYLQAADKLHLDIDAQGERYAAFERLNLHDPVVEAREHGRSLAHAGIVLVHIDGSRFVRCGWFHAFARSQDARAGGNADIAARMERVGWHRRGRLGRIKATRPGFPSQLAWSFFDVAPGWEDDIAAPGRPLAGYAVTLGSGTTPRAQGADQAHARREVTGRNPEERG